MKKIIFTVNTNPSAHPLGFYDHVSVFDNEGRLRWRGNGSTSPNGTKRGETWRDHYGWVAPQTIKGLVVAHPKYGKCILLNGGNAVASRTPNPNHEGALILTELFIHAANVGYINPLWRGSRGCPTIHRDEFGDFISKFKNGEAVEIVIRDNVY